MSEEQGVFGGLVQAASDLVARGTGSLRELQADLDERLRKIPNRLNEYGFDPFGLSPESVREEVNLGYVRPSLLAELGIAAPGQAPASLEPQALHDFDQAAGFVPHRKLQARFAARKRAIAQAECSERSARQPLLAWYNRLRFRWRHGSA